MKILLLGRTDKGGMKAHIESIKEELSKRHEVKILSQDDFNNINLANGRYYLSISGFDKLKKELDWCQVVHVHIPCSTFELILPWINNDKPIVSTFHFSLGDENLINDKKVKAMNNASKKIVYLFGKIYAKRSKLIVVGSALKEALHDFDDSVVINNGIPVDKFRKINTRRYFNDFTVGYLGRVDIEKNVETLIKACIDLNVNLVIAGMGSEYLPLKDKYECDKIKFLEKQNYPPLLFYNAIDVFCNPSFIEANINLTVLEAMACERPVIVCGCGGEESSIKESFGLVSKPDVESIKNNIIKIKDIYNEKMGKTAREVVIDKFGIEKMVFKIEKIYEELIANG